MLIDASQPLTEQDQRVLSMVIEAGRALVLAFNKWDLVDEDRRYLLEREIDRELVQVRVGAAGQHLRQDRPRGAETGAGDGDRAGVLGRPDLDRAAEHLDQRGRRGDPAAGTRWQAAAHPVRHPGQPRGRRPSCCSPPGFWRPATGASWSGGCAKHSASRAARSGSTCGCARSAELNAPLRPFLRNRLSRQRETEPPMSSYVIAAPETLAAVSGDLTGIGDAIKRAVAEAAPSTTALVAAAAMRCRRPSRVCSAATPMSSRR